MKAVHSIGAALRAWREREKLSQKDAAAHFGLPSRTYQDYERDLKAPGAGAVQAFIRAGINANWLLMGEGPMRVADLKPPPMKINCGALAALLRGAIAITAQGMSVEKAADMAAEMYARALESGEITPDGVGEGNLGQAA